MAGAADSGAVLTLCPPSDGPLQEFEDPTLSSNTLGSKETDRQAGEDPTFDFAPIELGPIAPPTPPPGSGSADADIELEIAALGRPQALRPGSDQDRRRAFAFAAVALGCVGAGAIGLTQALVPHAPFRTAAVAPASAKPRTAATVIQTEDARPIRIEYRAPDHEEVSRAYVNVAAVYRSDGLSGLVRRAMDCFDGLKSEPSYGALDYCVALDIYGAALQRKVSGAASLPSDSWFAGAPVRDLAVAREVIGADGDSGARVLDVRRLASEVSDAGPEAAQAEVRRSAVANSVMAERAAEEQARRRVEEQAALDLRQKAADLAQQRAQRLAAKVSPQVLASTPLVSPIPAAAVITAPAKPPRAAAFAHAAESGVHKPSATHKIVAAAAAAAARPAPAARLAHAAPPKAQAALTHARVEHRPMEAHLVAVSSHAVGHRSAQKHAATTHLRDRHRLVAQSAPAKSTPKARTLARATSHRALSHTAPARLALARPTLARPTLARPTLARPALARPALAHATSSHVILAHSNWRRAPHPTHARLSESPREAATALNSRATPGRFMAKPLQVLDRFFQRVTHRNVARSDSRSGEPAGWVDCRRLRNAQEADACQPSQGDGTLGGQARQAAHDGARSVEDGW